jgi:hypothetical protein
LAHIPLNESAAAANKNLPACLGQGAGCRFAGRAGL